MTQEVAENINFWRKSSLSSEKILAYFFSYYSTWQTSGNIHKGPQGKVTSNVEVIRPFLLGPRGCWKHKFLKKKANFPVKKRFSPTSSRIIEHEKRPETTYKGRKGNLTINVEVKISFLQEPRGCWKHKFLKKRQSLQWRKDYGLFLLVL